MIRLRKILLCNYFFYLILFFSIVITFIRINIPVESIYNDSIKEVIGIIDDMNIDGNTLTLTIKSNSKEKLIGKYYISTKKEKDFFLSNIKLGYKLRLVGNLTKPKKNTTKYLFNYNSYLKRKNIFYIMNVDNIYLLDDNTKLFYKIKDYVNSHATNNYVKTFILGDTSLIDSNSLNNYREIGISHLFAISGMHVSLISGFLLKVLKRLKINEVKRYIIVIIILLIYLSLTGLSPSVLRAVLFFIFFAINNIYYFYIKNTNIFLIVLSISLLINPFYVYDVGFLYSFSISYSLLKLSNYINKYKNYFVKLLVTSIISFFVSIPISLYNFNQINILSIIYNLFYVPFISVVIFPLSIFTFFINKLEPLLMFFINLLEVSSDFFKDITISKLIFCRIEFIFYLIYVVLVVLFFYGIVKNKKHFVFLLLIFLLVHYLIPSFDRRDYLTMIDVGQGDSILLHSNNKNILIDTGGVMNYSNEKWQKKNNNYSIVKSITIPYLKKEGIKKIDYLVLTHGDYDHLGEAINLIDNFNVNKVVLNDGYINSLEKEVLKKHKNTDIAKEGDYIKLGDFEIVNINTDLGEENDSSIVLFARIKQYKLMFMGDASIKTEEEILKKYNLEKLDILKLGHHGSRTSSSREFLEKVSPNLALISAGVDNKFNHPHQEVINTLKDLNINMVLTAKKGSIKIYL